MRRVRHFLYFILLIASDQIVKWVVRAYLSGGKEIVLIPDTLKLIFHKNDGAVWGILSGKTIFLVLTSFIILSMMLWFYFRIPETKKFNLLKLIVVFVCAGAVGNLIDRIVFGYVTDFIYFELINFPVFNIADCFITISAFLLVVLCIFYYKDEEIDDILSSKKKKENDKNDYVGEESNQTSGK